MKARDQLKCCVARSLGSLASCSLAAALAGAPREERWAVIISGASGGEKYAEQMRDWRTDLRAALVDRYGFKPTRS